MFGVVMLVSISVTIVTGQSNIQGLQVPHGSKVELEVEFRTQRNGQRGQQQQQQQQFQQQQHLQQQQQQQQMQQQQQQQMQQQQQQMQQQQQQMQQQQQAVGTGSRFAVPSSATQQLMNNMASMSMRMRRMTNVPVPNTEEPCPCDADCCARPMDPRRLVPVLEVPMTSHYGCCGCIDCPISAYPLVGHMIMSAVMMDRSAGRSTMGPA